MQPKFSRKLREICEPIGGLNGSESVQAQRDWDALPEAARNVVLLYHYGCYQPLVTYLEMIDHTCLGIRAKLSTVRPTITIKRWAKGMLAYWGEILLCISRLKDKKYYGRTIIR